LPFEALQRLAYMGFAKAEKAINYVVYYILYRKKILGYSHESEFLLAMIRERRLSNKKY